MKPPMLLNAPPHRFLVSGAVAVAAVRRVLSRLMGVFGATILCSPARKLLLVFAVFALSGCHGGLFDFDDGGGGGGGGKPPVPVSGCTNPGATNFNSLATVSDDSSCKFSPAASRRLFGDVEGQLAVVEQMLLANPDPVLQSEFDNLRARVTALRAAFDADDDAMFSALFAPFIIASDALLGQLGNRDIADSPAAFAEPGSGVRIRQPGARLSVVMTDDEPLTVRVRQFTKVADDDAPEWTLSAPVDTSGGAALVYVSGRAAETFPPQSGGATLGVAFSAYDLARDDDYLVNGVWSLADAPGGAFVAGAPLSAGYLLPTRGVARYQGLAAVSRGYRRQNTQQAGVEFLARFGTYTTLEGELFVGRPESPFYRFLFNRVFYRDGQFSDGTISCAIRCAGSGGVWQAAFFGNADSGDSPSKLGGTFHFNNARLGPAEVPQADGGHVFSHRRDDGTLIYVPLLVDNPQADYFGSFGARLAATLAPPPLVRNVNIVTSVITPKSGAAPTITIERESDQFLLSYAAGTVTLNSRPFTATDVARTKTALWQNSAATLIVLHDSLDAFSGDDYLFFGAYSDLTDGASENTGAFAIGARLPTDYALPTSGRATYTGRAVMFIGDPQSGRDVNAQASANVDGIAVFNANFVNGVRDGSITGNLRFPSNFLSFNLGVTALRGNARFDSTTIVCAGPCQIFGNARWRGEFFGKSGENGAPTKLGGTFWADRVLLFGGGNRVYIRGAFGARLTPPPPPPPVAPPSRPPAEKTLLRAASAVLASPVITQVRIARGRDEYGIQVTRRRKGIVITQDGVPTDICYKPGPPCVPMDLSQFPDHRKPSFSIAPRAATVSATPTAETVSGVGGMGIFIVHGVLDISSDDDYLAFGAWARNRDRSSVADAAAFAVGANLPPDYEFPTSGTATYSGKGAMVLYRRSGGILASSFPDNDVTFNATFAGAGATRMSGSLTGSGGAPSITFRGATMRNGEFLGTAQCAIRCGGATVGKISSGEWDGSFFGKAGTGGAPTKFGGTFSIRRFDGKGRHLYGAFGTQLDEMTN